MELGGNVPVPFCDSSIVPLKIVARQPEMGVVQSSLYRGGARAELMQTTYNMRVVYG